MFSICNGVNTNFNYKSNDSLEDVELRNSQADFEKEDIATEAFKGFEKTPRVVITRYDITPYLKKDTKVYPKSIAPHLDKLLRGCTVKLIQEDLEKLRQVLCHGSPRSDISLSEVNEAMGHLKCKICEKVYASEKKLQNHQENKHMIVYKPQIKPQKRVSFSDTIIIHEVKEYHKCRKCPRIYEEYKLLKMHMKERHKKRKCYICNYCNKTFMDRMFFKIHIRLHCDACGMLFPNKKKYIEHRHVCRKVSGARKLHKCITCNESYFRFMDLKDHSYYHLSTFFICDICKDQFETKCAVAHHIKFLHSEKRPTSLYDMRILGTERLYLCNFCEESSVERDFIEQHVQVLPDLTNRAMTGYKDYYFCDQCLKKFDTEKDMLQHKWTHFLKTSDNSQIREKTLRKAPLIKTTYKLGETIPDYMQPQLVLEKIKVGGKILTDTIDYVDVNSFDVAHGEIKKPVVDPRSKKTIISRHQCQVCSKYYSSRYCLNRHIITQHNEFENLRCHICEETFVWPSLLQSHKCIRLNIPEMPFDDARPEIHFDNLQEITSNGFDDLNITDSDDYINSVDFEIPEPIVTLNEYSTPYIPNQNVSQLQSFGYRVVIQEVPIEF
ncbi:zinc finger protein 808-like [Galleria mellonella]|uniref:Zinc finger protein 808-like n=1 Tax=Galleria mellonella TaxID=7137 RepID=A0A6J1WYX9_GALME|nr:zinc finger protein 808-like [Galleria mellonella]